MDDREYDLNGNHVGHVSAKRAFSKRELAELRRRAAIDNLRAYLEKSAEDGDLKPMQTFLAKSWEDYLKVLDNSPPYPHNENIQFLQNCKKGLWPTIIRAQEQARAQKGKRVKT